MDQSLELSPGKSSSTLFTLWTSEVNYPLNIVINDQPVPVVKNPKILGLTFDPLLTFNRHTNSVKSRTSTMNNVLKSLSGSTWGKDKETLDLTYKTICRPIINYAAPIFAPQLSDSNWSSLQRVQNTALRTITGCHKITHIDHLHEETNTLPVQPHTEMLAMQYCLKCHQQEHPNYHLVQAEAPPRQIRTTSIQKYRNKIASLPPPTSHTNLNRGLKQIHTSMVMDTIQKYSQNRVLRSRPPEIASSETSLPRKIRANLAQLRSGWCSLLESYRNKIDPTIPNACPDCGESPHDVVHLFNCQAKPTHHQPIDLWLKPVEAAFFLQLQHVDE